MAVSSAYLTACDLSPDQLVSQHAALVKRIAYHLINRLSGNIDVDDLIQAGMIGLLEAAGNYQPSKGANFETFAGIRIRGAMLDEVRRSDWTPRSVYQKLRKVTAAVREVEGRTGHDARDAEVASQLGLSLEQYHKVLSDGMSCRLFSLEQAQEQNNAHEPTGGIGPGPLASAMEDGFREGLAAAIESLPERERLVLSLYYDDELNLKEIGEVLGVSESRVCQIHGKAVVRIRARMGEWVRD